MAAPDFTALFPVCTCGDADACDRCEGSQLTPRTAVVLWAVCEVLADQAREDIENNGDTPVSADPYAWSLFHRYPRFTYGQNAAWRRRAARAFTDLAADLEAGRRPQPRCVAEEMALYLASLDCHSAAEDQWWGPDLEESLPRHRDDYDFAELREDADDAALLDHGVPALRALDGIEDPDSALNRRAGMGDYRPPAWFETFPGLPPR